MCVHDTASEDVGALLEIAAAFWIKDKVVFEQPRVTSNADFIVVVEGVRASVTGDSSVFQAMFTSSSAANDLLGSLRRAAAFRVRDACR